MRRTGGVSGRFRVEYVEEEVLREELEVRPSLERTLEWMGSGRVRPGSDGPLPRQGDLILGIFVLTIEVVTPRGS